MTVHFDNDHPPISAEDVVLIETDFRAMFSKATAQADDKRSQNASPPSHKFFKGTERPRSLVLDVDGKAMFQHQAAAAKIRTPRAGLGM